MQCGPRVRTLSRTVEVDPRLNSQRGRRPGARNARAGRSAEEVWQAGFYDHILRGEKVIAAVREYIRNNPENWGEDRDNPEHDSRFLQTMKE